MARQERASGRSAYETPWPLPIKGLLDTAGTSEIGGAMADVLSNWKSDGSAMQLRDGFKVIANETALQRIPFEFGKNVGYIKIFTDRVVFGNISYSRRFPVDVSSTDISSNTIIVDGNGPALRFNGSHFTPAAFTTTTGKDPDSFDGIFSHQDRPYLWDSNTLEFYYGGGGAVTGELTRFPLDRLGSVSGKIMLITSMTVNASHGMNDVLVIFTTTGWMILYEGLDPGDANDWRLLGRVKISRPVSKFAVDRSGADLWILTTRGIISAKNSLALGNEALVSSIAAPITDLLVADVKANRDARGWQLKIREDDNECIFNVPTDAGYKQYLFDMEGASWSSSDYPARWWHDIDGNTHFTDTTGRLCQLAPNSSDDGQPITATFHTSWVRLPRHSQIAYLIPTIIADGELTVSVTVLSDHDQTDGDIAQSIQTITIKPDNPGDQVALNDKIGVGAAGRVFQARWSITGVNVRFENLLAGLS